MPHVLPIFSAIATVYTTPLPPDLKPMGMDSGGRGGKRKDEKGQLGMGVCSAAICFHCYAADIVVSTRRKGSSSFRSWLRFRFNGQSRSSLIGSVESIVRSLVFDPVSYRTEQNRTEKKTCYNVVCLRAALLFTLRLPSPVQGQCTLYCATRELPPRTAANVDRCGGGGTDFMLNCGSPRCVRVRGTNESVARWVE